VNSALYGNFEDYVIQDVIPFIESEFRVMAEKNFRFITGQSMGGYGTAYLSLKYPELFRGAGPGMAAHLSYPEEFMQTWVDTLAWENGSYHFSYNAGGLTRLFFTVCGAFSPNLALEPEPIEMLFDTLGQMVDTVFEKWQPYIPCNLVRDLTPEDNLAFFLQCGTSDGYYCYPPYVEFRGILEEQGIDYGEAYHTGGHHFDPETTQLMSNWMDSLITESYAQVGIENRLSTKRSSIHVFPNPAADFIHLNFMSSGAGFIEIVDSRGITLNRESISGGKATMEHHRIDLSRFPAGVFMVRVKSGNDIMVRKIIKL
jgi:hypothetical protein